MTDDHQVRERLNERLAALASRVDAIESDFGQPLDDDFAEQAADREGEEAMDALENAALAEIDQIRAALHRLDAGSYGNCVTCGNAIAPRRLEVQPTASQCIACAGGSTN